MALTPEEEKIKFGLMNYNPTDEVGIRGLLTNQLGVKDDAIGWKANPNGGGSVMLNGYNFMDIGKDQIKDNRSFTDASSFKGAIDNYSKTYGYDFQAQSDPTKREYLGPYNDNLDDVYNQIMNYKYDPTNDPTYQALESKYTNLGEKAMRDTMGAASTLTGGRLNSYAQTAGQGMYNNHMAQLADYIPQLADKGMNDLFSKFNLTQGRDNTEYSRFNDERNFDTGNQQWDEEQIRLALNADREQANWDKTFDYNVTRDDQVQNNWDKSFDYGVTQDVQSQNNWDKQFNFNVSTSNRNFNASNTKKAPTSSYGNATPAQINQYETIRSKYLDPNSYLGGDRTKIISAITSNSDQLIKAMGQNLYNDLLSEARDYQAPSANPDSAYGQVLDSFAGKTDAQILQELRNNPSKYIAQIGSSGYNDLMSQYSKSSSSTKEEGPSENEVWSGIYGYFSGKKPSDVLKELETNKAEFVADVGAKGWQQLYDEYSGKVDPFEEENANKKWWQSSPIDAIRNMLTR